MQSAQALADKMQHREMTAIHILSRYVDLQATRKMFDDASIDIATTERVIGEELATLPTSDSPSYMSANVLAIIERAEFAEGRQVTIRDLIRAVVVDPSRDTLEDVDRYGIESAEQASVLRIANATGHLLV